MRSISLPIPGQRVLCYGNPVLRNAPGNRDLSAWWINLPQNRGGAKWFDIAGTSHGALTNGPTWSGHSRPGGFGSLSLNAASSQYAAFTAPLFAGGFCISAWVRTTSDLSSNRQTIVAANSATEFAFYFRVGTTGALEGRSGFQNTAGTFVELDTNTSHGLTTNNWHYVSLNYTGAALEYYRDGSLILTAAASGQPKQISTGAIGRLGDIDGQYWDGQLDDIEIFSRGLSASEVRSRYLSSLQGHIDELNWIRRPVVAAQAGGRTTKNTRAFPLGVNVGMGFQNCNI